MVKLQLSNKKIFIGKTTFGKHWKSTAKINVKNQPWKSTSQTNIENNIENQHRKSTLKTTLKINIKNQLWKKIKNVEKTSIFSTWPVIIIDQDALHACIQHITRIHSSEAPDSFMIHLYKYSRLSLWPNVLVARDAFHQRILRGAYKIWGDQNSPSSKMSGLY